MTINPEEELKHLEKEKDAYIAKLKVCEWPSKEEMFMDLFKVSCKEIRNKYVDYFEISYKLKEIRLRREYLLEWL